MKVTKAEREHAIDQLRKWIKPGSTVYTVLDHVSRSGMMRHIRILVPIITGPAIESAAPGSRPTDYVRRDRIAVDFIHPNYSASIALGWPQATRNGRRLDAIKVGGCGMDMGFHLVYSLSRVLFGDGWTCTGPGCHSNDHTNGDRDYTPHQHGDGGYAIAQRWL